MTASCSDRDRGPGITSPTTKDRSKKTEPLSNAERQRRFRERRDARLREVSLSLRNEKEALTTKTLRNDKSWTDETIDEALTELRHRGDQLVAGYIRLLAMPGLTGAETQTIRARFLAWRKIFESSVADSRRRTYVFPDKAQK